MKIIWTKLIISVLLATRAFGGDNTNRSPLFVGGDISTRFMGHYLSYRTGSALTQNPAFWTELNLRFAGGFYAQVFDSQPTSSSEFKGQQVDLAFGNQQDFGPWRIRAEYRISDFCPLYTDLVDFHYQCLQVSREMLPVGGQHSIRLGAYLEHMSTPGNFTEGMMLLRGGVNHSYRPSAKWIINDSFWVSHLDTFFKLPPGTFSQFETSVAYNLGKGWQFTPLGVRVAIPLDETRKFDKTFWLKIQKNF